MVQCNLKTDSERAEIVFGEPIDWQQRRSSIKRFRCLPAKDAHELIVKGYLDPLSRQNYSPTAVEMVGFALRFGGTLDGYIVSPHRADARVSLEGLSLPAKNSTRTAIAAFARKFRNADEFEAHPKRGCFCWFD